MTKNSLLIIKEAKTLGLSVEIISERKNLFHINGKNKSLLVCELFSIALDPNAEIYRLSKDKDITYALWKRAGVPFPLYHHFKNYSEFLKLADDLHFDYPAIVKETKGSKSINVHTGIQSRQELMAAAKNYDKGFIVQQMVTGKEYRLLMYKGKLLAALEMIPPFVIGNGVDTIANLIASANTTKTQKIIVHDAIIRTLKKDGFSSESVPDNAKVVRLQQNSRLAEGGTTSDCTDVVSKEMVKLAWRAVMSVNLNLGGVDMICSDIRRSPDDQVVSFLEVNTYPDLQMHYEPSLGKPRPVIRYILQDIFQLPA